jgi:hypothetical protein
MNNRHNCGNVDLVAAVFFCCHTLFIFFWVVVNSSSDCRATQLFHTKTERDEPPARVSTRKLLAMITSLLPRVAFDTRFSLLDRMFSAVISIGTSAAPMIMYAATTN